MCHGNSWHQYKSRKPSQKASGISKSVFVPAQLHTVDWSHPRLSLHITTNLGPESWLSWLAATMARHWWHSVLPSFKISMPKYVNTSLFPIGFLPPNVSTNLPSLVWLVSQVSTQLQTNNTISILLLVKATVEQTSMSYCFSHHGMFNFPTHQA